MILCGASATFAALSVLLTLYWEGFRVWTWTTMGMVVVALLLVVTVMVFAAYRLAQSLRRRLYELEEAVSLIASGRLHHRLHVMGEYDEIERIASQFNVMGDRLEQQVALLHGLAEENRRLAADAERAATIEERQRLARELHDSVSQQLFALTLLSASAVRFHAAGSDKLTSTIVHIDDLTNKAQREMRALLLQLRPIELDGRTFIEAARAFLKTVEERHGLRFRFTAEHVDEVFLSKTIEENLFRILQEAVANTLKHANAQAIRVRIVNEGPTVCLTVGDDGGGFEPDAVQGVGDTYGLRAMRERAQILGGRCDIWSGKEGTTIEVHIPNVPLSMLSASDVDEADTKVRRIGGDVH